jgi:Icc-related predicted phosphoesterase
VLILQISDIHGNSGYLNRIGDKIVSADIVAVTGDITENGNPESSIDIIASIEKFNRNILAVHGNWDNNNVENYLFEKEYNLHGRGKVISGIGFFGLGGSSPTPMHTPVEYSEEEIAGLLEKGYGEVAGCETIVLLSHTPPRWTRDKTFLGMRGGSRAVRDFLEKNRVDLCLAGHIHESRGQELLGSCVVANPGPFNKGRYLTAESTKDADSDAWDIIFYKV